VLIVGIIVGGLEGRVQLAKAHRRSLEAKVVERTSALRAARDELSEAKDNLELKVQQRTSQLRQEIVDREHAQRTFKESEANLRGFIDGSEDAICLRDRDRRLILWNAVFARGIKANCGVDVRTGMRAEDYVPKEVYALYNQQRQVLFPALEGERTRAEFAYPCPDGTTRYFDVRWTPVRIGGDIVAVAEVTRDITEQKIDRERLRLAEEKYRTVVENANEAIFVTQDESVKYCNALALEVTRYTEEEVRSRPFFEFIHPEDRGKAEEEYRKRLSGQELLGQYPIRILAKGGQTRWVLVNAALIDWEGRPASLTMLTDITSRIRAEEELRLSQETLKRAQSVAHIGSWQLDIPANALRWSDETHRIFGIPAGSPLTYERFLEVVHPEDRERVDAAWRASLNGVPYDIEHRIIADEEVR
jgi:PAS domain S-box-containing protein